MVDFTGIDPCDCKLIDCLDCKLWEEEQERRRLLEQEQAQERERESMWQHWLLVQRLPQEMFLGLHRLLRQDVRESNTRQHA